MFKAGAKGYRLLCLSAGLVVLAQSLGCVYALPPVTPPYAEHLRIVANSPERYTIQIRLERSQEYLVPADGRVTFTFPAYRRGCTRYLFGLRVSDGHDPLKDWTIELRDGTRRIRALSLRQFIELPIDSEGYRLLNTRG